MVLLYVPPVQNLLRREVTAYASKATGMQIQVERIDLRFPLNLLVRGVEVIQQPDTLLSLESLNVRDRKSTRLNSSHMPKSRMPSSA